MFHIFGGIYGNSHGFFVVDDFGNLISLSPNTWKLAAHHYGL